MKITKLLAAQCTESEFVFETDPPLTLEVLAQFNANDPKTSRHLKTRNGHLVITDSQMSEMRQGNWSKNPADVLSKILTESEEYLKEQAESKAKDFDNHMTRTAHFFGVTLG